MKIVRKSKVADNDPRGPYHLPDPDPKFSLFGSGSSAEIFFFCHIHKSRDNQHFRIKIVKKAYILWMFKGN